MVPKRKAAPGANPAAKKSKKAAPANSASSKPKPVTKKINVPSPASVVKKAAAPSPASASKKSTTRKKAADFYSSDSEGGGWKGIEETTTTMTTKAKKAQGKSKPAVVVTKKKKEVVTTRKPSKKTSESDSELEAEGIEEIALNIDNAAVAQESSDPSEDEAADDHAAMLLKGFESSDDEEEDTGNPLDAKKLAKAKIPVEKKMKKKLEGMKNKDKMTPGIIYLGRIPHGFYEHEMRGYFSQFGTITRLRLSRNKKTGASKHFAFIEFEDADVAEIAAETMNNYLLFGHLLKSKTVPRDNFEYVESLFKGANKRFKPRPGAKLQKAAQERKRTAEEWDAAVEKENKRRKSIGEKLKKSGIDYEFEPPQVEKPEPMAIDKTDEIVEAKPVPEVEEPKPKVIEPAMTDIEKEAAAAGDGVAELEAKVTKGKKAKKDKSEKAPKASEKKQKAEKPAAKKTKTKTKKAKA